MHQTSSGGAATGPRTARTGMWACVAGATIGALGLIGWATGTDRLTTVVPGLPPMTPNTALALLLVGSAAAARREPDLGATRRRLATVAALFVLVIGAGTLAEYALGIDLSLDRLLVGRQTDVPVTRPSPLTALALTCLAGALLCLDVSPRRGHLSEGLILGATCAMLVGATGIVLGAEPVYRLTRAPLIGLSVPAAASLLLTSIGLLLLHPASWIVGVLTSPGPGGVLLRRLALPAIVLPVLLSLAVMRLAEAQGIGHFAVPLAILASTLSIGGLAALTALAVPLNRVHDQLAASREQARTLLEQAPDGIFLADLDGRYTDVNDAGCRLLGCAREEIIGKTIADLLPPEDVERLRQSDAQLHRGVTHVAEWRLRRTDGGYVPVEVSARILPDGRWQGFVRDISERKRIEDEQRFLAELGPALATTLDYDETLSHIAEIGARGLSDFCIIDLIDESGAVSRLRVASRDPSRASMREALQRVSVDLRHPHPIRSALESRQPILVRHPTAEHVEAAAQDDADRRTLAAIELQSVMVIPLLAHGRLLGAISFLSTTPSRVFRPDDLRLAGELAQRAGLAVDNARLYGAAQRAIQARDEVLGIVAHDLRNPLGTILMAAGLLRRGGAARGVGDSAEAIKVAVMRMNRLIQNLLDVTRLEAGQFSLERSRVPAVEVVAHVFEVHRALASPGGLQLRIDVPDELPDLWADRDQLLRVLENLIANAIKFTPAGGIVTIGATARQADVLFWVGDTGPGISADDQARLFDRLWQARTPRRSGAGLGLSIVKGIVEAHGGEVWVESTPGRGSTFFFTMPTARGEGSPVADETIASGQRA